MKCNESKKDRTWRILIGVAIIAIGVYYRSWWGLVGLVPLITGLVGYCPIYSLLGKNTCKTEKSSG